MVNWWLAAADRRSREGVACRRHLDDLDRAISTLASPKIIKRYVSLLKKWPMDELAR